MEWTDLSPVISGDELFLFEKPQSPAELLGVELQVLGQILFSDPLTPCEGVEDDDGDASVVAAGVFGLIFAFGGYVVVEGSSGQLHQLVEGLNAHLFFFF